MASFFVWVYPPQKISKEKLHLSFLAFDLIQKPKPGFSKVLKTGRLFFLGLGKRRPPAWSACLRLVDQLIRWAYGKYIHTYLLRLSDGKGF